MKKIFLFAIFVLMAAAHANAQLMLRGNKFSPLFKLQLAEQAISQLYVDTVNDNKLVEDAIRGMLEKLDPHSSYTDAKQTKAFNEPLAGDFEGIGVQFNIMEDTLVVIQPVVNGPSEKVGIMSGDRIIAVNDTAIAGVKMAQSDIMKRLRGKKGTLVNLTVVRPGVAEPLHFTVKRAKIPVHSVTASYMIRPGIGYIRIENFGAKTYQEFMDAVNTLRQQGMKNLMLDLQDNGGGLLISAVSIVNEFLRKGDMIVYTQGRAQDKQTYKAHGDGKLQDLGVVVLVNELTASAAEITSGAIQDQDRGLIVGRRTFGKGLVQRPVNFHDGSMMRLTVAHYYTPSGRCIQKPYTKGDLKDYEMDLENRLKHGELTNKDSIHFADSLKYITLRKHRTVYGGGGIMPDVFVPLDTMKYTRLHRRLVAKSIVIKQCLKYIDSHRDELRKAYPSFAAFRENYEVPQALLDTIFAEGKRQKIVPKDADEQKRTLPYLQVQLKALIARDLWTMNEYFEVWNEQSDIVQKGLEIMQDKTMKRFLKP